MANNFFIIGMPKAGKTTLIQRLVRELKKAGLRLGGFFSPEQKEHGTREGFFVEDIETGRRRMLACVGCGGPKVSKYGVDVKSFESIALPVLNNFKKYDVVVVDEIGRMELKSGKFEDALESILNSDVPLIATLHRDFVDRYKLFGKVYQLTETSHEAVYLTLLNDIKGSIKKSKTKSAKTEISKSSKKEIPEKSKVKVEKQKTETRKPGFFQSIRKMFGL